MKKINKWDIQKETGYMADLDEEEILRAMEEDYLEITDQKNNSHAVSQYDQFFCETPCSASSGGSAPDLMSSEKRRNKVEEIISREEAIELVGEEMVFAVETETCEPTGRRGYNGFCQNNEFIEWSASVALPNHIVEKVGGSHLVAYYYTNRKDEQHVINGGAWSDIDWEISGYCIE